MDSVYTIVSMRFYWLHHFFEFRISCTNKHCIYTWSLSAIIFTIYMSFCQGVCCVFVQLHPGKAKTNGCDLGVCAYFTKKDKILNGKLEWVKMNWDPGLFHVLLMCSISCKWPPQRVSSWHWDMGLLQTLLVLLSLSRSSAQHKAARTKT